MHDPPLVRFFQGSGNLRSDGDGLVDRNRTPRNALRKRLPRHELEHEIVHLIGSLEPVDGRNIGMVQRREDLRLSLEAREPFGVSGELSGRTLIATSLPSFPSLAR